MSGITKQGSAELGTAYRWYVTYECVLINLLGFFTLFFQCELQHLAAGFKQAHPTVPAWQVDCIFGHYWLSGDLNCNTEEARCLTKMVAGWLMIGGVLQAFINFDTLRMSVFKNDWLAPRGLKIICLYTYFICDWYWVVLMYSYRNVVGWQQIFGSMIDILIRLVFVVKPSRMFKEPLSELPSTVYVSLLA